MGAVGTDPRGAGRRRVVAGIGGGGNRGDDAGMIEEEPRARRVVDVGAVDGSAEDSQDAAGRGEVGARSGAGGFVAEEVAALGVEGDGPVAAGGLEFRGGGDFHGARPIPAQVQRPRLFPIDTGAVGRDRARLCRQSGTGRALGLSRPEIHQRQSGGGREQVEIGLARIAAFAQWSFGRVLRQGRTGGEHDLAQIRGGAGEIEFERFRGERERTDVGPGDQRLEAAARVVAKVVVDIAGGGVGTGERRTCQGQLPTPTLRQ